MLSKELSARKNIRLKKYDYSRAGCYFVTICVKDKHEMLGKIVGARLASPADTGLASPADTGLASPADTGLTSPADTGLTSPAGTGPASPATAATTSPAGTGLASPATVELTEYGEIARNELINVSRHYNNVLIDCFVIMPNHIHAMIVIHHPKAGEASLAPTLGHVIGGYKSGVSRLCGFSIWQRCY